MCNSWYLQPVHLHQLIAATGEHLKRRSVAFCSIQNARQHASHVYSHLGLLACSAQLLDELLADLEVLPPFLEDRVLLDFPEGMVNSQSSCSLDFLSQRSAECLLELVVHRF